MKYSEYRKRVEAGEYDKPVKVITTNAALAMGYYDNSHKWRNGEKPLGACIVKDYKVEERVDVIDNEPRRNEVAIWKEWHIVIDFKPPYKHLCYLDKAVKAAAIKKIKDEHGEDAIIVVDGERNQI